MKGLSKESKIDDLLFVIRTNMKRIRKEKGKTLQQMSDELGKDPSYLSRMEAGKKKLNFDIIDEYAISLGVDPFDFFLPSGMVVKDENNPMSIKAFGDGVDLSTIDMETLEKWKKQ